MDAAKPNLFGWTLFCLVLSSLRWFRVGLSGFFKDLEDCKGLGLSGFELNLSPDDFIFRWRCTAAGWERVLRRHGFQSDPTSAPYLIKIKVKKML